MKRLFKITAPVLIVSFIISPLTPLFAEEITQTPPIQNQQVEIGNQTSFTNQPNLNVSTESQGEIPADEVQNTTEDNSSNSEAQIQATSSSAIEGTNPPTPIKQLKPETDISTGALNL